MAHGRYPLHLLKENYFFSQKLIKKIIIIKHLNFCSKMAFVLLIQILNSGAQETRNFQMKIASIIIQFTLSGWL